MVLCLHKKYLKYSVKKSTIVINYFKNVKSMFLGIIYKIFIMNRQVEIIIIYVTFTISTRFTHFVE